MLFLAFFNKFSVKNSIRCVRVKKCTECSKMTAANSFYLGFSRKISECFNELPQLRKDFKHFIRAVEAFKC